MDIVAELAGVPFLAGIARAELALLAAGCRVEQLPRGAYLFHEGQPGDRFHVITAPRRLVLGLLDRHPPAVRLLSQDLSRIALALNEVVADLVFLDVPQRVARYLLTTVDDAGVVNLGLTQEDAAARLGTTRVSFHQALAGLVKQGMVQSLRRGRIRLLDVPALERFVKG